MSTCQCGCGEPVRVNRDSGIPNRFVVGHNNRSPAIDRLLAKCVETPEGCWVSAGVNDKGYAQVWVNGSNALGHRVAYEHFVGDIPARLQLDHLCRNRACVNPWHLEPVTCQVNLSRSPDWVGNKGLNHRPSNATEGARA